MKATESFKGFDPKKYGAKDATDLEGFLFPATYELKSGDPVDELVGPAAPAFKDNIAGVDLKDAKKVNLTPYDVLTIASMVEREAVLDKERPIIASVIYNRLKDGINLGHRRHDPLRERQLDQAADPVGARDRLAVQHADQRRPSAGADREPRPGLDRGGRQARQDRLPLLRGQARRLRRARLLGDRRAVPEGRQEQYNSARDAKGGQSPERVLIEP